MGGTLAGRVVPVGYSLRVRMARGKVFEIEALPDIRRQVVDLAKRLLA